MTAFVLRGDARRLPLPDACVDLIVTSPPYFGLRSYTDGGVHYGGQIGSEASPGEWVAALVECTREWARVLKPSGSMFINLGDKYSQRTQVRRSSHQPGIFPGKFPEFGETWAQRAEQGAVRMPHQNVINDDGHAVAEKSLMGLPWRYAIAATDQLGLILRRDIIWAKPNGLPESVTDRCRSSHEYVFHLTRQPRYYAAVDEIREPYLHPDHHQLGSDTRGAKWTGSGEINRWHSETKIINPLGKLPGSVWNIPSQPLTVPPGLGVDHFAAFPSELPRRCVLGWSPGGVCVACGEGRRPVVDRTLELDHMIEQTRSGFIDGAEPMGNLRGLNAKVRPVGSTRATITGYACACPTPDAPTRPSVVLDPFGGTGTTALVASVYGRTGISIDHSADYNRIAAWRTQDPAERCRVIGAPKPPPVIDGQDALWA